MTFGISILFEEKKGKLDYGLLRRDILFWCLKSYETNQSVKSFKFTDIGKFLISNHQPFIEEFTCTGYGYKESYKLQSKRTYITGRIDELNDLGLIKEMGKEKADKNRGQDVSVYSITQEGIISAYLVKAWYTSGEKRKVSLEAFFTELSAFLTNYPSSFAKCIIEIFNRLVQQDLCSKLSNEYLNLFTAIFQTRNSLFYFFRHILLAGFYTYDLCSKVFLDVVEELDDEDKKIVLMQLKLDIESNYCNAMGASYDWEDKRLESIGDPNIVILQGYCLDCKERYGIGMDIFRFLELGKRNYSAEGEIYITTKILCPHCDKKESRFMIPVWYIPSEILAPNMTSIEEMEKLYDSIQSNDKITPKENFKYIQTKM